MTIYEYLGIGSHGRTSKNFIRSAHETRLENLLKKNSLSNLDYSVFKDSHGFYILFKIPSEKNGKIYYDAIVRLKRRMAITSNNLKDYDFEYISNSPDFVFFYAYLFNENNMLCTEFANKLPEMSISTPPDKNNSEHDLSNCKGLFWCILTILNLKLDSVFKLINISSNYNKELVGKQFRSYHEIEKIVKESRNEKTNNNEKQVTGGRGASKKLNSYNKNSMINKPNSKPFSVNSFKKQK